MAAAEQQVQESITAGLEIHKPRSIAISQKGIRTGTDFANLMSALMSDLIEGRVSPQIGNAVCNAGGRLLKAVEMQHKYGRPSGAEQVSEEKTLTLAPGGDASN